MTGRIVIMIITIRSKVVQGISLPSLLLTMLLSLSSCGSYGSSFACKDARGLNCVPLSIVDQRINSGEIAEVELKDRTKCKGRYCYVRAFAEKPNIKPNTVHKIKLQQETDQKILKDGNLLYIK